MKKNLKNFLFALLALFLFIAVWTLGFIHGSNWGWQANLPSPFEKVINKEPPLEVPESDMSIFWDTWKVILEKYVGRQDLDPEKIIIGATKGLVGSLDDPYSEFLTAEQTKELSEELSGEFFGVGMEIGKQDGYLVVISPLPGTPAEKAGLRPNDMILAINDTETVNLSTTQAAQLIRGQAGTKVILTIYRSAWNEAKKIELTREKIIIPSASWEKIDNNIALIDLSK